MKWCHSHTVN